MNHGLVSVVIPTYNYGRFVTDAVVSALNQSYSNMEVIVVDDGSTDDTRDRLAPYLNRIEYIYKQNQGLAAARNTGIRRAQGKWIALLDSDDLWHPRKTELQLDTALRFHRDAGTIMSPAVYDRLPSVLENDPSVRQLSVYDFLVSTPAGPSSALIRKDLLDQVGYFDEQLPGAGAEDRDMWLRLAAQCPIALVKSPCWFYRIHQNQMCKNAHKMYISYQAVLRKFFREYPAYARYRGLAWSYFYLDATIAHLEDGSRLAALKYVSRSLWHWPWFYGKSGPSTRFLRLKLLARLAMGETTFRRLRPNAQINATS